MRLLHLCLERESFEASWIKIRKTFLFGFSFRIWGFTSDERRCSLKSKTKRRRQKVDLSKRLIHLDSIYLADLWFLVDMCAVLDVLTFSTNFVANASLIPDDLNPNKASKRKPRVRHHSRNHARRRARNEDTRTTDKKQPLLAERVIDLFN